MITRTPPFWTPIVVIAQGEDRGRIGRFKSWPADQEHATIAFGAVHVTFRPEDLRLLRDDDRVVLADDEGEAEHGWCGDDPAIAELRSATGQALRDLAALLGYDPMKAETEDQFRQRVIAGLQGTAA